jgi:FkbM family methyltransferase
VIDHGGIPVADRLVHGLLARGFRGAGLARRFLSRLCSTGDVTVRNKYGVMFRLRLEDHIDGFVARHGYYESEVLEALRAAVPPDGIVWDVGANFGLHAVTLKVLRPDVRVICFEPSPTQAARILANAEVNGITVEVLCIGLGDRSEFRRFHTVTHGNPGMSTFAPWDQARYDLTMPCYVETGDRLIQDNVVPAPSAIKMDIEGGEAAALRGLAGTFAVRQVRTLVFEGGEGTARAVEAYGFTAIQALARAEGTGHGLNNYRADLGP